MPTSCQLLHQHAGFSRHSTRPTLGYVILWHPRADPIQHVITQAAEVTVPVVNGVPDQAYYATLKMSGQRTKPVSNGLGVSVGVSQVWLPTYGHIQDVAPTERRPRTKSIRHPARV